MPVTYTRKETTERMETVMNFAVLPASGHSQAKLVKPTQPSKPNTRRSDSVSEGPRAASGAHAGTFFSALASLTLRLPGLPLPQIYPQWIHSGPARGMDGLGHYPWSLRCPCPQPPIFLLHKLYVTLPSSGDTP